MNGKVSDVTAVRCYGVMRLYNMYKHSLASQFFFGWTLGGMKQLKGGQCQLGGR